MGGVTICLTLHVLRHNLKKSDTLKKGSPFFDLGESASTNYHTISVNNKKEQAMGLSQGKTNNPAGRPKGTPNRIGAELRERVIAFVENRWDQLESDFDEVTPRERLIFIEKLMAYTLPKLQAVAVDYREHDKPEAVTVFRIPDNGRVPDYSKMPTEELRAILARSKSGNAE